MALPIPLLPGNAREMLAFGLPLMLVAQKPANDHTELLHCYYSEIKALFHQVER